MDNLAWLGDASRPLPQAPVQYRPAFVGLNPALFEPRPGPSVDEQKAAMLNAIFSPVPNALNQLNRIGGAEVPLYDSQLTYEDVFRNAGYDELAAALLGLGAGAAEPGPGELKALAELLPTMAILARLPREVAEALVSRAAPAQRAIFGEALENWTMPHGTMHNFDAPHSDFTSMGRSGRGYYSAIDDNLDARRLRAQTYGTTIRDESAVLENPFVIGSARRGGEIVEGFGPQLARPNLEAMQRYKQSLVELLRQTKGQYSRNNIVRIIDKMDDYIARAARGEPIEMDFAEFRSLTDLPEVTQPSQVRARGIEGGSRGTENYTALASDAFGFDGVISLHNDELVSFRPERSVVYDEQSALRRLQEMGISLEELKSLLPEGTGGF